MKILSIVLVFSINLCFAQTENSDVNNIFNNIIKAIGNNSKLQPGLEIKPDGNKMAYLSPKANTIYIDQKAIDICNSFDKNEANGLAFLLGHELTHHYMGHSWISKDDRKDYKGFSFMENIRYFNKDSTRRLEMESQADLKGGFSAFLAGYDALTIAPDLLDTLYERYELSKKSTGYPSLDERKGMCLQQIEKLDRLKSIFNASTYALNAGYYKGAQEGFTKIISEGFNSREIYNNLALAYLLDALKKMDNKNILGYPFEFDAQSRLNDVSTRAISNYDNASKIKMLIEKGILLFNQALKLDSKYQTAQLNICCAYSLLAELYAEDDIEKNKYLSEANKSLHQFELMLANKYAPEDEELRNKYEKKPQKTLAKYNNKEITSHYIISAILINQNGEKSDSNKAKKLLLKASKLKSTLANINLAKLNGTLNKESKPTKPSSNEIIDGFKPASLMAGFSDFPKPFDTYRLNDCKLYVKKFENSTAYLFKSREKFFIHTTKTQSTSAGLKINNNIKLIESKYNEYPITIKGTIENFYHLDNNNLLFLEKDNKISGWATYQTND
ncbi:MAG: hypothetical protein P8L23_01550 [Flavobacteriales bacterium]|nr:hypothetical protein [Flavobacteriales bacterium]